MQLGPRISGPLVLAVGLAVQAASVALTELDTSARTASGLVAGALLVAGGALAARGKGYSPWLGFAGLLGYVGAVGLLLLPERSSLPIELWPYPRLRLPEKRTSGET